MEVDIQVLRCDIAKISSDTIVIAMNPDRTLSSNVKGLLKRASGEVFINNMGRSLSNVIYVPSRYCRSKFKSVLFVSDELPVYDYVMTSLKKADLLSFGVVTLPLMKISNKEIPISDFAQAITDFVVTQPKNIRRIIIVINNNRRDNGDEDRNLLLSTLSKSKKLFA
jgi:hypothetical protein